MRGRCKVKNLDIVGLSINRPPVQAWPSRWLGAPQYVPGPDVFVSIEYMREGAKCREDDIRAIGEVRGSFEGGEFNRWKFKGIAADGNTYLYNLKMAVN